MIHVRSARGKNSQGRKITGIEPMPGEDKVKNRVKIVWRMDIMIIFFLISAISDFKRQSDKVVRLERFDGILQVQRLHK